MNQTALAPNLPKTIGQVLAYGVLLDIVQTERGGRPHLQLFSTESGSPFGTLTSVVPTAVLDHDEVIVRTSSENEPLRQPLLDSGYFVDTGKRIPSGYIELEVWKRSEPAPIKVVAAPAAKPATKKK